MSDLIGIDTNILVRYFTQDDATQAALASELLESLDTERSGFISLVVLTETIWVMQGLYRLSREDVGICVAQLLHSGGIVIEYAVQVAKALSDYHLHVNTDFADVLIHYISLQNGCSKTFTFDKTAARHAGMTLLK